VYERGLTEDDRRQIVISEYGVDEPDLLVVYPDYICNTTFRVSERSKGRGKGGGVGIREGIDSSKEKMKYEGGRREEGGRLKGT
jgi:hypothetical protein